MIVVAGITILLILVWVILPKKEDAQFIDTKSIQIDKSS